MTGRGSEAVSPLFPTVDPPGGPIGRLHTAMNAVELTKLAAVLGRKWTPTLLVTLADGPMRHGPLTRKLRGISRKVLHESLDGLMIDGLIEKAIFIDDCGKPATTYGLTSLGSSLIPVLQLMQAWCSANLASMLIERSGDEVVILLSDSR